MKQKGWSGSVNWGKEEHVENDKKKKMMGWAGLDQTLPSLCILWPNLCVYIWVYRYI